MHARGTMPATKKAYDYPRHPHQRKHGPGGYADYEPYRDWLRDEFLFRCVVCLERKQWIGVTGKFHIDHNRPQSVYPEGRLNYDNLVYLCARCNLLKNKAFVPDVHSITLHDCLVVSSDGTIVPLNADGKMLVDVFRLDSKEATDHRAKVLNLLRCFERCGQSLQEWLGFPDDLPDLRKKQPPSNNRPHGVEQCCCALRERGELPSLY